MLLLTQWLSSEEHKMRRSEECPCYLFPDIGNIMERAKKKKVVQTVKALYSKSSEVIWQLYMLQLCWDTGPLPLIAEPVHINTLFEYVQVKSYCWYFHGVFFFNYYSLSMHWEGAAWTFCAIFVFRRRKQAVWFFWNNVTLSLDLMMILYVFIFKWTVPVGYLNSAAVWRKRQPFKNGLI